MKKNIAETSTIQTSTNSTIPQHHNIDICEFAKNIKLSLYDCTNDTYTDLGL